MPVSVTALACEGERGMVNGDVGRGWGKRVWGYFDYVSIRIELAETSILPGIQNSRISQVVLLGQFPF